MKYSDDLFKLTVLMNTFNHLIEVKCVLYNYVVSNDAVHRLTPGIISTGIGLFTNANDSKD